MIAHQEGVKVFTLFSNEDIDLNDVPASKVDGTFSDLTLFGSNHAYGILQAGSGLNQHNLVQFELEAFVTWKLIESDIIYHRSGYHIRKDNVNMSISYLSSFETVTVMNNPQNEVYRQKVPLMVDFPIYDFLMIGYYEVLICGLSGEVCLMSYDEKVDNRKLLQFKLNLDAKEMVSFAKKSPADEYIFFATSLHGNPHRIFVYKFQNKTLQYCTEWAFFQACKGTDSTRLLQTIQFIDYNEQLVVIGIEQGLDSGLRIWKLVEDELQETGYMRSYFMDSYADSHIVKQCLWTLEQGGIMKATHVTSLLY